MESIFQGNVFFEMSALFAMASILGFAALKLKQPLIIVFILVGLLAGPSFLDIVKSNEYLELMSHIGISILLFLVGLKLDIKMIKTVGLPAIATGLGQVLFTSLFGFLICYMLGMSPLASLYVSIALTFSSTIIIVKLLSDKQELDTLHGRIALGFLIVQDLFVIISMVAFSAFGMEVGAEDGKSIYGILLSMIALIGFVILFAKYFAEKIIIYVSKSHELLLIFSIFLAMSFSSIAYYLGLGMELGGLLAGIALASTSARDLVSSKMASLRDFLLFFFFITLGVSFQIGNIGDHLMWAIVLSAFILIGNPLIVMVIMGLLGYKKRTGFMAGLTVAQISEFSLIFVKMGQRFGHLDETIVNTVTIVGIITIAMCTYMISYSNKLYEFLEPFLSVFESKKSKRKTYKRTNKKYDVILFGLGNYGQIIIEEFKEQKIKTLGVDFNPDNVKRIKRKGYDAVLADISDLEFLESIPLLKSKICICVTTPSYEGALLTTDPRHVLLDYLKENKYKGRVVVRAKDTDEVDVLNKIGVEIILNPFKHSASYLHEMLNKKFKPKKNTKRKNNRRKKM